MKIRLQKAKAIPAVKIILKGNTGRMIRAFPYHSYENRTITADFLRKKSFLKIQGDINQTYHNGHFNQWADDSHKCLS